MKKNFVRLIMGIIGIVLIFFIFTFDYIVENRTFIYIIPTFLYLFVFLFPDLIVKINKGIPKKELIWKTYQ